MKSQDLVNQSMANEWMLLQNQFDSYEKYSLIIKLAGVAVFAGAYFAGKTSVLMTILLLVIWLQDAIWKTFQARIENRLLQLEAGLKTESDEKAYQFNREYLKNRPGTLGLVKEYLSQSVRPTIAFPHVVLVLMSAVQLI
ncbi:hypothetical protein [Hahella ganghwensis]|uniref:hypothetical protein n=1 Tax=Hahella ganghwensis TaxID=286420 RepID=UPI00037AF638